MNLRKSILTALLLAAIGIFLSGCGCSGGECPFRKIFGSKQCQPCDTTTPAPAQPADAGTK
jgi:hypothetical protein